MTSSPPSSRKPSTPHDDDLDQQAEHAITIIAEGWRGSFVPINSIHSVGTATPSTPSRLAAGTGPDRAVSRRDDDVVMARRGVRYARKRLDLAPGDVVRGLALCASRRPRDDLIRSVASAWVPSEAVVATLSVRSGFDLLLGAVGWPPGSEVVFSAVTIPHLAILVRSHGFVPVSVDLCPDTLEVDPIALQAACTERTRAVVIAQLFGARSDLTAVASFAAARGLLLIEDCAQCYDGADRRFGVADVAMYSFGTIKTATCLAGASCSSGTRRCARGFGGGRVATRSSRPPSTSGSC